MIFLNSPFSFDEAGAFVVEEEEVSAVLAIEKEVKSCLLCVRILALWRMSIAWVYSTSFPMRKGDGLSFVAMCSCA